MSMLNQIGGTGEVEPCEAICPHLKTPTHTARGRGRGQGYSYSNRFLTGPFGLFILITTNADFNCACCMRMVCYKIT